MATYEFKCCGTTQEVIVSMKEAIPVPTCSICNGLMNRQYDTFTIKFKGKGFYATDK